MRRFVSMLLAVLLGATAVAIGMGIFLYKANTDRKQLAEIAAAANDQAIRAAAERERAVHEANTELTTAKDEVAKAQAEVIALKEEREALARATPLDPPTSKTLRGWMHVVSLPLKVTLSLPTDSLILENTDKAFGASFMGPSQTRPAVQLQIVPYSAEEEQGFFIGTEKSTPVSYAIRGRLFQGFRGTQLDAPGTTTTVLVVQLYNQKTHLIRITDPKGAKGFETAQTILSTIDIAP